MVSPKNQALDTWTLLQVSPDPAEKYIVDSAGSKIFNSPVLAIRYLSIASFSDISVKHRMSLELRVKKKLQCYPEKIIFDS